jgi:hypothetical protein
MGSGNQSEQSVPVAPDPGTDDAGQITEVRKDPTGFRRFEAKLDLSGHRYEAFFESPVYSGGKLTSLKVTAAPVTPITEPDRVNQSLPVFLNR